MFEIDYINEYDVKLLLSLRHQLEETPDEKIKTKVDLINAIKNLSRDLKLKPKVNEATEEYRIEKLHNDINKLNIDYKDRKEKWDKNKTEILLLVEHSSQIKTILNTVKDLIGTGSIIREIIATDDFGKIETARYDIRVRRISENIRGVKSKGHVIKLTSHRDVLEVLGK